MTAVLALAGCGKPPDGFVSLQSPLFFTQGDTLVCGSLEIHPKSNGFLSGFYAVAPGTCQLTLHPQGAFFGTSLCEIAVKENAITSVYLTRRGGGLTCEIS